MNPLRKVLVGGAMAGAALVGGAVGASFLGTANAQTPSSSSSSSGSSGTSGTAPAQGRGQGQPGQPPDWSKGGHQANGITETVLTGDDAAKATAAAEAAEPGATAQRAETDAEGATYEVHMTKSDGSIVTVKLDSNFNVTSTVDGMG
ncbi:MAG TPA: hypothetical protein VGJ03_07830 [Acidimicrobiales bacterium]|jgi:hypothetical protein